MRSVYLEVVRVTDQMSRENDNSLLEKEACSYNNKTTTFYTP